ncbi:Leucine-, glutamate- and lysine-rich protein 1 [Trifolium repens]|nr:Leucine-, glutamate- and lysine-rich protein 1 [Trifolium repens]
MHVYVATSLLDLNWFLGLFGSSAKKVHISDHSTKIDEPLSRAGYILLITIVIGVVLLYLYRSGESKERNFNYTNKVDEEEPVEEQLVDESDRGFDWDEQFRRRNTKHGGALRSHVPCAFCGDQSTTRCARCKVARYCSVECQIKHWRSWHRHECFRRETEEDEARDDHDHQNPMLVENYDNESMSNGSHSNGVELMSSNVGIMDGSSSSDVSNSHVGCEQCGSPSTTRCSRCKAVRYCSTMCLIMNWKWHKYNCVPGDASSSPTERPDRNEEEENIHSSTPLYLELHPEGTSNFKSPTKVSQITTTEENDKTRWVKHLEDELVKSRKENFAIQSERDEWKKAANIARERFQSFKEESEKHLSALRNENESISNAEKKACDVIRSLQLQIAAQENIAEKRRLEEHIQMLESECSKLKKELQEEHKHAQYLTLEYNKNHETTLIALGEVEALKQELLEEREHVQRVKDNFIRDVAIAESRAIFAEAKFSDLQRKIKLTDYKVLVKTDSLGKPSIACTICLTNEKDMAFGCGHMTCRDCGSQLSKCPICREQITSHIKLFPG